MLGIWDVFFEAADRDKASVHSSSFMALQKSSEQGKTGNQAASKAWAVWKVALQQGSSP